MQRAELRSLARIDDDAAIHFLVGDFDPIAAEADLGPLVGRAVKAFGKRAVHVGGDEAAVLLGRRARRRGRRSGPESAAARSSRRCADFDHGIARIVAGLADRDLRDAKRAAAGRDRVEHLGQDQAVDDVAGDFDLFDDGNRAV